MVGLSSVWDDNLLSIADEYQYSGQLKELDKSPVRNPSGLGEKARVIRTPLKLDVWQSELSGLADDWFAHYVCSGIEHGFRIGFHGMQAGLRSCDRNMVSTREHPEVVESYLTEERQQGRLVSVSSRREADKLGMHCSPFGVIPKKGRQNKWRLIIDLSTPEGHSVNDGISKELSSLSYLSVDKVMLEVLARGRGTLLAKMDIRQAYRNIPVHPDDRHLLGVEWKGEVLVDTVLPFGLRSAPLLFTAVGDALQWIMEKRGVSWAGHYIDDFVTMGAAGGQECGANLREMECTCTMLGMPVKPSKTEGPATTISFLGLELDTRELVLRLPVDKLDRLQASLASWRGKKHGKKRDLLSLIGLLSHACKAIRPFYTA